MSNQSESKTHIQQVLRNQVVETDAGIVVIAGEPWEVFEYEMAVSLLIQTQEYGLGHPVDSGPASTTPLR